MVIEHYVVSQPLNQTANPFQKNYNEKLKKIL